MRLYIHVFEHPRHRVILEELVGEILDARYTGELQLHYGQHELETLRLLHNHALHVREPEQIGYVHLKGVTKEGAMRLCADDWRRYMSNFIIGHWIQCRDLIDAFEYDLVGVNWHTDPFPHFSGNFWWASSAYLKTLNSPQFMDWEDRSSAERWIGRTTAPDAVPRVFNFMESHVNHYHQRFPRESYARS